MPISIEFVELCDLGDIKVGSQNSLEVYAGADKVFPCGTPPIETTGSLTSKLYPIEQREDLDGLGPTTQFAEFYEALRAELEGNAASIVSGELRTVTTRHDVYDVPELQGNVASIQSGELRTVTWRHDVYDMPEVEGGAVEILSGTLEDVVIRHTVFDPPEVEGSAMQIISGTLV